MMCRVPVSSTLLWARSIFLKCKKLQIWSDLVLLVLYDMCSYSTWYYIFSLTKLLQCISVLFDITGYMTWSGHGQ